MKIFALGGVMKAFARAAAALTGGLALLIGAARLLPSLPPDRGAFARLFADETGCCLLGIEPGMPLAEAVQRLRAHPWTRGVPSPDVFQDEITLAWSWSGAQPASIDATVPGYLFARSDTDDTGHYVVGLSIETHLRLYDVALALGAAPNGSAWYWPQEEKITYQVSYYDPDAVMNTTLRLDLPCPARLLHYYWHPRTQIIQWDGRLLREYVPPEQLPHLCREGRRS